MNALVNVILSLAQSLLPYLGLATNTAAVVTTIINALETILPEIEMMVPSIYNSIKNIITALTADPSTSAAQLATLQALDAQVDAAFETAAGAVDPDATPTA